MQQAITAKRTTEPPTEPTPIGAADRLDALGQLLYGEHWIVSMARDLKIFQDTITKWASGTCELPSDNPFFGALAVFAKARRIMNRQRA